ncbi:MAG: NAD-dependent deacylase [Ancalomicrobiaceae bacterium]|nr:NAD-dependent deacylase [Ancalomicrobiaceae bacterium]
MKREVMTFPPDLIEALRTAHHVVVSTGAGVSQESGIPTFRDGLEGLWEIFDPEQFATPQAFARQPDLVWGWYEFRRAQVAKCLPNPAHQAIATLARKVRRLTVITQNVDNLHERAGSTDVIHLHGSLHAPICASCGQSYMMSANDAQAGETGGRLPPPTCPSCGGLVRPGIVWFGEMLPEEALERAQQATLHCDVFFSIGTSVVVYPAAALPFMAAEQGACVVQINPEPTGLDDYASFSLVGKAGEVMPELVAAV